MKRHSSMLHVAISGVLALAGTALASTAIAADDSKEQCAGIAKNLENFALCHRGHGKSGVPSSKFQVPRS